MKKFWKVTLIPGLYCILAGLVLSAILTLGFSDELREHADEFSINENNFWKYFEVDEYKSVTRHGTRYSKKDSNASYHYTVPEEESIHGIDFEFAVGEVQIRTGDCMELVVTDMFENAISSYVEDGVWYITDSLLDSGSVHSEYCPEISITLPKNLTPEFMQIYLAAGMMDADNLVAGKMQLEVDAGSMKVFYLMAEDSLAIKNGVGEVKIYDAKVNNLSIDEGIGAISVTGKINGHNIIKGGIGEVKLSLTDRNHVDFNYKVTCGIGDVEIGDWSFSGNCESSSFAFDDADYFEVDCGIGHIEIDVDGN